MLDDTFYLYARYKGSDKTRYYTNNKNYTLQVKVGRFNKRVKIAHVHGFENKQYEGSQRHYQTKADFEQSWKVIKDYTEDNVKSTT